MGVNDLDNLFPPDEPLDSSACPGWAKDCIRKAAQEAWHPASEPPTESDGHEGADGLVLWCDANGRVESCYWWLIRDEPDLFIGNQWARIRDVVLLPE